MAKLYIVGTPIGNLQDITLRALDTLKMVDVIACEDTRHSLPMLTHYDVHAKLIAYHKFNEAEATDKIISLIQDGKNVAIITDAGMPSISDPGAILISACREQGIEIELVPGPTAFASAITLSGIKSTGFIFLGFLPEKAGDRKAILSKASLSGLPIVIYVAPHDLNKTARQLFELFGNKQVYVCRELTKMHEEVTITSLQDFSCEERGEIVMIIENTAKDNPLNELSIEDHIKHYLDMGLEKKEAIKKVSQDRGIPKNEVYQIAIN